MLLNVECRALEKNLFTSKCRRQLLSKNCRYWQSMINNMFWTIDHSNCFEFCTLLLWKKVHLLTWCINNNGSCIFCTVGRHELCQKCFSSHVSSLAGEQMLLSSLNANATLQLILVWKTNSQTIKTF